MAIDLSEHQFLALAENHGVVPLSVEVLADRESPVTIFETLVGESDGFLLESVEGGETWARWSFVGWDPEFTLVSHHGAVTAHGADISLPEGDPFDVLEDVISRYRVPDLAVPADRRPPLHAGAVGYLAYDAVRYIENLPNQPRDDRDLPEYVWQFVRWLGAIDRFRQTVRIIRNVFVGEDPRADYANAVDELSAVVARLGNAAPYEAMARPEFVARPEARANMTQESYEDGVRKAIGYIEAGDAFQIVPSLRLEVDYDGDPFAVYRALRLVNPSPFLYYVRHGGLAIAGSSPEIMSRARDGVAVSRPIAGTRPRGTTPEEDLAFEQELLADPKERAEHVMLVDLSRNDLGRVCEFGSVHVEELMVIERYSHVMHIVSGVAGKLRPGMGPVDLLRATFPHGTVSGAPKVRAMEIIDELEPTARGPYAGAVGYIDFSGNLDTAIGLRTAVIANGKAWVQAGAGVVADSDPTTEYLECLNKAAAVLAAIAAAV